MPSMRVMVVGDHEVVRTGLKSILEPEGDLEVVGEAASATEAVQKVARLGPHVVLMDVRMEEVSGIEACRLIKSAHPEVNVLMLTSFSEEEAVTSAIMAGASGYLLKNVGRADLLKSIRAVAGGDNLLDPAVTGKVMERLARLASKEEERATEGISDREKEVLAWYPRASPTRRLPTGWSSARTRPGTTSAASWISLACPAAAKQPPSPPSTGSWTRRSLGTAN